MGGIALVRLWLTRCLLPLAPFRPFSRMLFEDVLPEDQRIPATEERFAAMTTCV